MVGSFTALSSLCKADSWCFTLNILARKLADDCCKFGAENQNTGSSLARAALQFGKSHKSMEDERETLLGILGEQVIS